MMDTAKQVGAIGELSGAGRKRSVPRNLVEVIDAIIEVAPDLKDDLWGCRDSCFFTAPEAMYIRWREVANILNAAAIDHPKCSDIATIFAGPSESSPGGTLPLSGQGEEK